MICHCSCEKNCICTQVHTGEDFLEINDIGYDVMGDFREKLQEIGGLKMGKGKGCC